jgi:hypothetical protein
LLDDRALAKQGQIAASLSELKKDLYVLSGERITSSFSGE